MVNLMVLYPLFYSHCTITVITRIVHQLPYHYWNTKCVGQSVGHSVGLPPQYEDHNSHNSVLGIRHTQESDKHHNSNNTVDNNSMVNTINTKSANRTNTTNSQGFITQGMQHMFTTTSHNCIGIEASVL